MTPLFNLNAGSSSATITIPSTVINQFNIQEVIGMVTTSVITTPITFSFLTRLANTDITLTPGMTASEIRAAILASGVTIVGGSITLTPEMRPLVVIGLSKDLSVLGPLLGLESPENCISGTSFSYPINGLVFPLPMATTADIPMLTVSMNSQTIIATRSPTTWDINNRYNTANNPVTEITVTFVSPYGFPLNLLSNVIVVMKCN